MTLQLVGTHPLDPEGPYKLHAFFERTKPHEIAVQVSPEKTLEIEHVHQMHGYHPHTVPPQRTDDLRRFITGYEFWMSSHYCDANNIPIYCIQDIEHEEFLWDGPIKLTDLQKHMDDFCAQTNAMLEEHIRELYYGQKLIVVGGATNLYENKNNLCQRLNDLRPTYTFLGK